MRITLYTLTASHLHRTADPNYWKGEVFVYVGRNQNLKDLKDDYWKGEVFAYVGSIQNLKDLKL